MVNMCVLWVIFRNIFSEPDEIDDLENAERVGDKEEEEPPFLIPARSVPECEAF